MRSNFFFIMIAVLAGVLLQDNAKAGTVLTYNDFSSTSGYGLLGSATQNGNVLQLTSNTPLNQVGGVFFTSPVDVSSFNALFTFEFSSGGAGDGLVFVIKNMNSTGTNSGLGGNGEALGYADRYGYKGFSNSVGIEFDSHINPSPVNDISANHIGINTNASVISLVQSNVLSDFNSAIPWHVWVDYDGAVLSVYINQTNIKPVSASLTGGSSVTPFIIKDYVGSSTGLMGFTASTGGATQITKLLSFNYNSPNPEPSTYVLMGVGALIAGMVARRKSV
ncbi:MAG: PEP-CTERM sorting domain-containing protein, partial [Pelodictyon phaeoclathratiforme]